MTMYLSEITLGEIIPIVNLLFTQINNPDSNINIPLTIKTNSNLTEDVSDLNGIAIPAMYEAKINKNTSSLHKIIEHATKNIGNENNMLIVNKFIELSQYPQNSPQQYLLMSNLYIALSENIFSKLNQINQYNWISDKIVEQCHSNLEKHIDKEAVYEQIIVDNNKNYFTLYHDVYGQINISGRIDVVDNTTLWELKCVSSLTIEHLLQLIIYSWLWEKTMIGTYGGKKYKILNIRTNEVRELKYQEHLVNQIIELIFINKCDPKFKNDDDEFIDKCVKTHKNHLFCKNDILSMFDIEE